MYFIGLGSAWECESLTAWTIAIKGFSRSLRLAGRTGARAIRAECPVAYFGPSGPYSGLRLSETTVRAALYESRVFRSKAPQSHCHISEMPSTRHLDS